jgi:hypothetical protein
MKNLYESFFTEMAKIFTRPKIAQILNAAKDDPELLNSLADLEKSQKEKEEALANFCEKYPDSYICKKYKKG